jgi:hypothetical protein
MWRRISEITKLKKVKLFFLALQQVIEWFIMGSILLKLHSAVTKKPACNMGVTATQV